MKTVSVQIHNEDPEGNLVLSETEIRAEVWSLYDYFRSVHILVVWSLGHWWNTFVRCFEEARFHNIRPHGVA